MNVCMNWHIRRSSSARCRSCWGGAGCVWKGWRKSRRTQWYLTLLKHPWCVVPWQPARASFFLTSVSLPLFSCKHAKCMKCAAKSNLLSSCNRLIIVQICELAEGTCDPDDGVHAAVTSWEMLLRKLPPLHSSLLSYLTFFDDKLKKRAWQT